LKKVKDVVSGQALNLIGERFAMNMIRGKGGILFKLWIGIKIFN